MIYPSNFIQGLARELSEGDLCAATRRYALPTVISIGSYETRLVTPEDVADFLSGYLRNLRIEDYVRSKVDILYVSGMLRGRVQVLCQWVNLNSRGAVISTVDIGFLLQCDANGRLGIKTAEVPREPIGRHISGLNFRRFVRTTVTDQDGLLCCCSSS